MIWDTVHAQNLYCFKGRLDIFIGKKSIKGKSEYIEITFNVKCVWVSSSTVRTLGMMYLVSSYNVLFLKVNLLHSYFLSIHFGSLSEAGYWAGVTQYSHSHKFSHVFFHSPKAELPLHLNLLTLPLFYMCTLSKYFASDLNKVISDL